MLERNTEFAKLRERAGLSVEDAALTPRTCGKHKSARGHGQAGVLEISQSAPNTLNYNKNTQDPAKIVPRFSPGLTGVQPRLTAA